MKVCLARIIIFLSDLNKSEPRPSAICAIQTVGFFKCIEPNVFFLLIPNIKNSHLNIFTIYSFPVLKCRGYNIRFVYSYIRICIFVLFMPVKQ